MACTRHYHCVVVFLSSLSPLHCVFLTHLLCCASLYRFVADGDPEKKEAVTDMELSWSRLLQLLGTLNTNVTVQAIFMAPQKSFTLVTDVSQRNPPTFVSTHTSLQKWRITFPTPSKLLVGTSAVIQPCCRAVLFDVCAAVAAISNCYCSQRPGLESRTAVCVVLHQQALEEQA